MFGQSLSPGLVIESGSLNRIHSIGPEGADVDAGVRWKDLLIASFDHGLTPSVLTGYTNLSIGGTLSVGGMSGRNYAGAQVDHVRELEVVTGVGNVHRCSDAKHSDLFEAVLAGLGQCGVMTRAKIELVPAKQMARLYNPLYFDTATFFQDIRTLVDRNELSEVYNIWVPAPDGNGFVAAGAGRPVFRSRQSARQRAPDARLEHAARGRPVPGHDVSRMGAQRRHPHRHRSRRTSGGTI